MILFTQSTAVLRKYLNHKLKILCYNFSRRLHGIPWVFCVQRNPWVFQVFQVCGHPIKLKVISQQMDIMTSVVDWFCYCCYWRSFDALSMPLYFWYCFCSPCVIVCSVLIQNYIFIRIDGIIIIIIIVIAVLLLPVELCVVLVFCDLLFLVKCFF